MKEEEETFLYQLNKLRKAKEELKKTILNEMEYLIGFLHWRIFYRRILENKIKNIKVSETPWEKYKIEMMSKLKEWRGLRTKYDRAIFDEKGYFIRYKKK